jgi:uncharacterized membrane protein
MTLRHGPAGEDGGATLVGLALASFVLLAGLVAVDVGALAGARAAAQTAADLAALAALTPQLGQAAEPGPGPSWGEAQAAGIAAANGAELVACDCSAVQAVVKVRRRLRLVPGGVTVAVTASARAVLARTAAGRATRLSRKGSGFQAGGESRREVGAAVRCRPQDIRPGASDRACEVRPRPQPTWPASGAGLDERP